MCQAWGCEVIGHCLDSVSQWMWQRSHQVDKWGQHHAQGSGYRNTQITEPCGQRAKVTPELIPEGGPSIS